MKRKTLKHDSTSTPDEQALTPKVKFDSLISLDPKHPANKTSLTIPKVRGRTRSHLFTGT